MSFQPRFPHLLKDNKTGFFPSQVVFLDVESSNLKVTPDEEEATLKFGYALYQERERKAKTYVYQEWKYFDIPADLFIWLYGKLRSRRVLYLLSSNIWFDLRVSGLLRLLLKSHFRCDNYFIKGLSQIFIFRCGDKKVVCLNFQNFFRLSVKEIGEIIGREKKVVDFKTVPLDELKEYCQEDVRIIRDAYEKWRDFCEYHNLGTFGKTLSSQAFNSYRHRFMKNKIYIHTLSPATKLERRSYFGGRTECFFIGKKKGEELYYLDINSFYPYVMRRYEYPTRLTYYNKTATLKQLENFLEEGCTVAEVNLTTSEPSYPVRYNSKTVFPVGTFDAYLCTEGLKRAVRRGEINRVWSLSHYASARIFARYVDYFWKLRQKYREAKNTGWEHITKMFLNYLYGKFGQLNDELLWERECDPELIFREVIYHLDLGYSSVHTCFGGVEREVRLGAGEGINSFVGIASHVTEYARLLLWKYIKEAGRENVFYCDTDSLIVNREGYEKLRHLISPGVLGKFKLEEVSTSLEIRGLKDYTFGSRERTKGIRKDAERIDENTYRQVQFPSYLGELRAGLRPTYRIVYVKKKLSRKYDKGEVLFDGRVEPFKLDDRITL